jgi:hypothetical protein
MRLAHDRDVGMVYVYVQDPIPPGGVAQTISLAKPEAIGRDTFWLLNVDLDDRGRLVGVECSESAYGGSLP